MRNKNGAGYTAPQPEEMGMFATIAVNPITANIAIVELKRRDGAILKLDSAHELTALRPDGTVLRPYGAINEADDFLNAAMDFMRDAIVPAPLTEAQSVAYQDQLAGVDSAVLSAAANLETGSESATDGSLAAHMADLDIEDSDAPGSTEAEILAGADGDMWDGAGEA